MTPMPALDWTIDPIDALRRWPEDRPVGLLHAGRFHPRWARRSILAVPDDWVIFPHDASPERDPFDELARAVAAAPDKLWIGYLGYDLGRWIEAIPQHAENDRDWPLLAFARCARFAMFDHERRAWTGSAPLADDPVDWRPPTDGSDTPPPLDADPPEPRVDPDAYRRMVQRTIDYIGAGDVFQVNIAQRFSTAIRGRYPRAPRDLFVRLNAVSPAWYGAYLETPGRRSVLSTSPELFLEKIGRRVVTRPIKGTRPASVPASELLESEKDRAELHMIVDLLRNDLGRVCEYGSVRVAEPRTIESHPTVHHGVATIEGQLQRSKGLADMLRATMPGGSITGAPKVRAMQIIEQLEPVRRGPYCGAIGYVTAGGEQACLNVAIRTMLMEGPGASGNGRVDFSVGGGVVADSDPQLEYQETLDKAAAMVRALGRDPTGGDKP